MIEQLMLKKALITGISGFAGSYLAEFLLSQNYQVFGIVREKDNPNLAQIQKKIKLFQADLQDKKQVKKVLAEVAPDQIYHLAGFSVPRLSFGKTAEVFEANVIPAINLFESLVELKLASTFVNIGSSEEYGLTKNGKISENTTFNPASPYAVSKLAQDFLGFFYFKNHGIPVIRLRPFNHIGPRQEPVIAVANFAKQIAQIEAGAQESVIKVGNLKAKRDFCDVRDMVEAYWLAADKCTPGEVYNIGSGISYSLAQILEILLSFSKIKIKVKVDKNLLRSLDVPEFVANPAKFIKATGWKPKIKLGKTLKDILNYWRTQLRSA